MPSPSNNSGEPGQYSNAALQLAEALMAAHGMDNLTALQVADQMLNPPAALKGQLPVAPFVAPLHAADTTHDHLEDANLSAWQQYSQMLDTPRDAALGQSSGRRKR